MRVLASRLFRSASCEDPLRFGPLAVDKRGESFFVKYPPHSETSALPVGSR